MYKENCGDGGFFKWLHVLLLMDDIVIMATSRGSLQEKLNILNHFCVLYGMVVNRSKTKFMVLHGDNQDRQPLQLWTDHWIDLWIDLICGLTCGLTTATGTLTSGLSLPQMEVPTPP